MFPGVVDRIRGELIKLAPSGLGFKLYAAQNRNHAVFQGASILSQLSTLTFATKAQFEQAGVKALGAGH